MNKQIDLDLFQDIDSLNENQNHNETLKIQPNICKLTILDDIDQLSQKIFGYNGQDQSNFAVQDYSNYKFPQFQLEQKQTKVRTQNTGQKPSFHNARLLNKDGRANSPKQMSYKSSDQKKQNFQKYLNKNNNKLSTSSLNKDTKPELNFPLNKMLKKDNKYSKNFEISGQYYGQIKDTYGNNFVEGKIRNPGKNFIDGKFKQKLLVPSMNNNAKNSPLGVYAKTNQNLMKISNTSQGKKQSETTQNQKDNKQKLINFKKSSNQKAKKNTNIGCTIVMKRIKVDLTANLEEIIRKINQENGKSDYQFITTKSSVLEVGLFGKAIEQNRNNKTNNGHKAQNSTNKQSQGGKVSSVFHISAQPTHQKSPSTLINHHNSNYLQTNIGNQGKYHQPRY